MLLIVDPMIQGEKRGNLIDPRGLRIYPSWLSTLHFHSRLVTANITSANHRVDGSKFQMGGPSLESILFD